MVQPRCQANTCPIPILSLGRISIHTRSIWSSLRPNWTSSSTLCVRSATPNWPIASTMYCASLVRPSVVTETPERNAADHPEDGKLWEHPDPPSLDRTCDRCGMARQGLSRPLWWPSLRHLLRAPVGLDATRRSIAGPQQQPTTTLSLYTKLGASRDRACENVGALC
jgi:hypothetical protein